MIHNAPLVTALRAALTLVFLYFGLRKLGSYPTNIAIYDTIGFGQFPRYITGSIEVAGAGLLLLLGTMIVAQRPADLGWPALLAYVDADGGDSDNRVGLSRPSCRFDPVIGRTPI